jgi:hypothetical protein
LLRNRSDASSAGDQRLTGQLQPALQVKQVYLIPPLIGAF